MTSEDVWIASLDDAVVEAHALVRQPDNGFATVCGIAVEGGHIFVGSQVESLQFAAWLCANCMPVAVAA